MLRPAPLFERIVVDDTFPSDDPEKLQYVLSDNRKLIYVPKPGSGAFNRDGYRGPWCRASASVLVEGLGPGTEVVNLGVRGYGLLQELEYLKEKGLAYAPAT